MVAYGQSAGNIDWNTRRFRRDDRAQLARARRADPNHVQDSHPTNVDRLPSATLLQSPAAGLVRTLIGRR